MTAIQTVERLLRKVQQAQAECINDCGYVRSGYRYRYQVMVREEAKLRESLEVLQGFCRGA